MTKHRQPGHQQAGFTLIELIVMIVIVGILGVGIANFVVTSTQGMMDTAERQQLATIGWVVSEKVSREVREALPNSFRTNDTDTCLEFIPAIAGTDYLSVPTVTPLDILSVVPFPNYTATVGLDRFVVYPNNAGDVYGEVLSAEGAISSPLKNIDTSVLPHTLTLKSNHGFKNDSPTRRLYVVQKPVMYCFEGRLLNRYSGYDYANSIPGPADAGAPVVIGSQLDSGRFSYLAPTLSRNGIVIVTFDVKTTDGVVHAISQEVQIRNVP